MNLDYSSFFKSCLRVTLCLSLFHTHLTFAQEEAATEEGASTEEDFLQKTIEDAKVVVIAGVGGAVIGLSTLSFVEEPSEHLRNIFIGGAVGMIAGVGFVVFRQATRSETKIISLDGTFPFDTEKQRPLISLEELSLKQTPEERTNNNYTFWSSHILGHGPLNLSQSSYNPIMKRGEIPIVLTKTWNVSFF